MIHTSKKTRLTLVLISSWTIVQSIVHLFWVIYGYLLSICQIRPTYYDVVFVYLTYFYKQSCGPIHLKTETLFLNRTVPEDERFQNETVPHVLFHFLNDTLGKAVLPHQSRHVSRTQMYLLLWIVTDGVWIISAVCLFVKAFCKTRQKYLSIVFYGPWLLSSAFVNLLDVVSAVQYGIDMIYIRSYTSWLDFIGVANSDDFLAFNDHPSSSVIPVMPTTVLVSLLSRIFFGWLLNVICFFVVLFLVIPDVFLKTTVSPKPRSSSGSRLRFETGEELDLNTSQARIRNWQLFYGAIEANSTMATGSPGVSAATHSTELNSTNSKPSGEKRHNTDSGMYENPSYEKPPLEIQSSGGYRRYSDVANSIVTLPVVDTNNTNMPLLKGHMPWSYISPEGNYVRKQHTYTTNTTNQIIEEPTDKNDATFCTRL